MLSSVADRMVDIDGTLVPAVNIQVDGKEAEEFGVYFEVMFENGDLWVIDQQPSSDPDHIWITVAEHDEWAVRRDLEPNYARRINAWDEFLDLYNKKRMACD